MTKKARKQCFFFTLTLGATIFSFNVFVLRRPFRTPLELLGTCDNEGECTVPVDESPHYLIHTEGCTIPDFNPSHPSIVKYRVKTPYTLKCSLRSPLTEESGLSLILYDERMFEYGSSKSDVNCSYQGIIRIDQNPDKYNGNCDRQWKIKEEIPIDKRETNIDEDSILVTCFDARRNTTIYRSFHFFIQPWRALEKRNKFKNEAGDQVKRRDKPSIIIFGTDAVSRGNLRRHMPLTFHYLTNHLHVIDLKGFTKVADNTDPNLTALLMGLSYGELINHTCTVKARTRYDACPLIWKDFAEKGYVTAYGEDAPWMGVFHYQKVGFCKKPTDYYNRPYFYASEKNVGNNRGNKASNGNLCQGGRTSIALIHSYSLAIAEELKDIPYFGFYWTASVTHDYLTAVSMADQPSLDYLKQLNDRGHLENTILFFISDHGLRWGSFRSTYAGMLEERMPYVTIAFPNWFIHEYPEAMKNMKINTKRLTSTFDIYATLRDIVNQAYIHPSESSPTTWRHGQSLFREVPANRTCKDAGIPEHYCACEHTEPVDPEDSHVQEAAKMAVDEINKGLSKFPKCAQLSLKKVLGGRKGSARNNTLPKKVETVPTTYLVTFITKPGEAEMESTLKLLNGTYDLVSEVSRINKYGNQSHCLTDQIYRKYCYCKDLLH